jgi:uncharacterized membrane protein required for colicin V production
MDLDKLPVKAFDFILVVVLVVGVLRGRKHGMSEELMPLLKWLAVIIIGALIYEPLGHLLAQSTPFTLVSSYLMVYVGIALVVFSGFALVKHSLGGKLVGSDIFGGAEYYLGMVAGLVRVSCMLVAGLALLNARYFSPKEVKAMENFQNDVYGSNFFPTLHTLQAGVFEHSLTGPWIRDNLGFLLIKQTEVENKQMHQKDYEMPQ